MRIYKCLQRIEINIYLIHTYFELYHRKIFRHSFIKFNEYASILPKISDTASGFPRCNDRTHWTTEQTVSAWSESVELDKFSLFAFETKGRKFESTVIFFTILMLN